MKLIDKIACYGIDGQFANYTRSDVAQLAVDCTTARVINLNNVSDYVESIDRRLGTNNIPNAAPPFNSMFFEWDLRAENMSFGVWVQAFTNAEYREVEARANVAAVSPQHSDAARNLAAMRAGPGWVLNVMFVTANTINKIPYVLPTTAALQIAADGTVGPVRIIQAATGTPVAEENARNILDYLLLVTCLGISFMHCRNVTLQPTEIPEALAKKHKKVHGVARVKYHVLEIAPMRQVLQKAADGAKATGDGASPLHICRGHFKDYRQSGLFGKVKGIFWWDHYVRGSAENGQVLKDYEVKV